MLVGLRVVEQVFSCSVTGAFFGSSTSTSSPDDWWLKAMLFAMVLTFVFSTAFPAVQATAQQNPIFLKQIGPASTRAYASARLS
jgi:hypothetical protein